MIGRPRRMRYSFETRCRAVTAMLAGVSPGAAAQAARAARRLSLVAALHDGGLGGGSDPGPARPPRSISPAASARTRILAARRRSGAGPVTLGSLLGRPASTGARCRRRGHSRRPRAPRAPVVRYERAAR